MKRVLSSILCALGFAAVAAPTAITPARFTDEFVEAVRRALPAHSVTRLDVLRLRISDSSGKEIATEFLDNAYSEYTTDPSAKEDIIRRHLGSLVEIASAEAQLDPQNIVPIIKDRAWIEEMRHVAASHGTGPTPEQVFETFADGLVIVYAVDTPTSIHYLSTNNIESMGLTREKPRELAVSNLHRILPPVQTHRGPQISMLTAGGDYVASLLLFDELWNPEALSVEGEIVVAVPSRDVLLFTGSKNAVGLEKLKSAVERVTASSSYRLTNQLFVRRNGAFQKFAQ